jgi:hypothetical protein
MCVPPLHGPQIGRHDLRQRQEFVGLLKIGTTYKEQESTSLGVDFLLYERFGNYERFSDYTSVNSSVRLYVRRTI